MKILFQLALYITAQICWAGEKIENGKKPIAPVPVIKTKMNSSMRQNPFIRERAIKMPAKKIKVAGKLVEKRPIQGFWEFHKVGEGDGQHNKSGV